MTSPILNKILKSHPLAVLMVITALDRFTEEVVKSSPSDYPERGLVHYESWIALAKDIQTQLHK